MVNGPESRETLASSFKEVFDDVNEIQKNSYIMIDGNRVDIGLFLGGDYKVDLHICVPWLQLIIFFNFPSHIIKSVTYEITSF